jgi:hypothetical protein
LGADSGAVGAAEPRAPRVATKASATDCGIR